MSERTSAISWRVHDGEPITIGALSIMPQSRALVVRWPFGGLMWNRASALVVRRGAHEQHVRIVDVTRLAQIAMLSLSALMFAASALHMLQERRGADE